MSKKPKARTMKSPQNAPPDLDLPHSAVKQSVGITEAVYQFLEVSKYIFLARPLTGFSTLHNPPRRTNSLFFFFFPDGRNHGAHEPLIQFLQHSSGSSTVRRPRSICQHHQHLGAKHSQRTSPRPRRPEDPLVLPVPRGREPSPGQSDAARLSAHGQPGPGPDASPGDAAPSEPAGHQLEWAERQHLTFSEQQEAETFCCQERRRRLGIGSDTVWGLYTPSQWRAREREAAHAADDETGEG